MTLDQDMLTRDQIQSSLGSRMVRFYEQVDSTNDIAMEWVKQGAPVGSVVVAEEQLKGRGRKGRTWHTPPGVALAVSVILRPDVSVLSRVSMLGAVAIAELCVHVGLTGVGIKWPNDVQVGGRKVSGVLPEALWEGQTLMGVVLGMGVNVRVAFGGTALADTATSLETELGRRLDRLGLLAYLLNRVDHWSARLGEAALFHTWQGYLTTVGQDVVLTNDSVVVRGRAEGVDEQGALLVRSHEGALHRIVAGDIALG